MPQKSWLIRSRRIRASTNVYNALVGIITIIDEPRTRGRHV